MNAGDLYREISLLIKAPVKITAKIVYNRQEFSPSDTDAVITLGEFKDRLQEIEARIVTIDNTVKISSDDIADAKKTLRDVVGKTSHIYINGKTSETRIIFGKNQEYQCHFQNDGNIVVIKRGKAIWETGTYHD